MAEPEEPWTALLVAFISAILLCCMFAAVGVGVLLREHTSRVLQAEERDAKLGQMKAIGTPMGPKLGGAVKRVFSGLLDSSAAMSPDFHGLPGRRRDEATAERLLGSV